MSDIDIRRDGRAGRITLTRPQALNALTHDMCLAIEAALDGWRDDDAVALVLIDAAGERAFCSGGDIVNMYQTGRAGDFAYGQRYWRDEYRMNAKLARYPKPVVSLMQGFTMGGGVGVGCHASHRVVCETSRIAMPECSIGLVPDVGGSYLLARAPGRLGDYLGVTGARMAPADAMLAGFADHFVAGAQWPALIAALVQTGDPQAVMAVARPAPSGMLAAHRPEIDRLFAADDLGDILRALKAGGGEFASGALNLIARGSPLSMACTVEMLRRLRRQGPTIAAALRQEYRFTCRAPEHADFIEGIRAAIIDKDKSPHWRHAAPGTVPADDVAFMLASLGDTELHLEESA